MSRSVLWANDFPPVTSGIATYFVNLWRHLPPDRVAVIAPRLPGAAEIDRTLPFPVRRVWLPLGESAVVKGVKTLLTILRALLLCVTERPARFHCGQVFSSGIAGLAGHKLCGIPYVVYVYGSETVRLGQGGLARRLMQAVLRESERVVACSTFTASEFVEFGVNGDHILVVYPGVDTDRFRPGEPDRELVDRFQLDGKYVLLTVARLDERKGHDTVIRALAALGAEGERFVYLIVGKGREEARLRRLADDLGLRDRVVFAGYVPDADLPRYYTLCTVFVMPNRMTTQTALAGDIEGFGISFIEASACGKPVIAGRSGGAQEAVVDEETGLLVDPESPDAVAAALLRVFRDPDFARRLGEAGRRRAEAEYDWRRLAKRVEEIL
ncbi:MAG: glycosyltransferase family 4 protein [Candidatus Latescibacteria bacterium]|nr:glycosyltransferase family 4 protein [Candidatus Latescibacterota bacterium]